MSAYSPPRRQNSTLSSTSSGGRTIRASSTTPGRRRSSASTTHPPPGFFARLTGKSHAQTSDADPSDDEDEVGAMNEVGEGEAGPSDYWRRTPSPVSPPAAWREASTEAWPEDLEDGNYDVWKDTERQDAGVTPWDSVETDSPGLEAQRVDEREYEKRMRDIMRSPSLSERSVNSARDRRIKNGYAEAYRDIMDKDPVALEDTSLEFPQRDDTSEAPSSSTPIRDTIQSPRKQNVTPYLHPSVSRLRSHMRTTSTSTQGSSRPQHARIPSHFSQISLSRSESTSNLSLAPAPPTETEPAFTFSPLRHLSAHLFGRRSGRSSPAIPRPAQEAVLGRPCVLDVRGMIAVGTDSGYTVVYGFGQDIKCILGTEAIVKTSGAVTAVTISPDQTYVAVGHAGGNIYLYDLASPGKPARTALALPLKQVLSGRKEGHLQNSRITHIGYVGARHTSIVSGDEHGRAFWWSLGKVMGVESTDVVRMLGSYPDVESPGPTFPSKRPTTLFAAAPLPLGQHPTDEFHFTVLVTPLKIVVVGMKPSAKTWYRKMREDLGGVSGATCGCAAWLTGHDSDPVLAYSWGHHVRLLRIQVVQEEEDGKVHQVPRFIEGKRYDAPSTITALQWFDPHHLLIITTAEIVLLDVRLGKAVETTPLQTRLLMSNDFYAGLVNPAVDPVAGSVRVHREKLFLLTRSNVQVGTLLHWNDRILARVHAGDFLGAIQVALSYYESKALGNYIGLSDDDAERRQTVGSRIRELMRASLEWAFSEERMRDDTHYTSDGRGVDLTSLFEGLATCCIEACLAMDDVAFLYEDAYESYASVGIQGIFLAILEPYIFDHRVRHVPPIIIQALINLHETKGELDLAEAVIWHVDPIALDINQVVTLCEKHGLWDALIHVYTRSMKDFTAPLVKLVEIVQKVYDQRQRDDVTREHLVPEAYKLFAYIEAILSGMSYPSNEALPDYDSDLARGQVYAFIFSDRLVFWPEGREGQLVLPHRNQAYPYLDLLLQFDTEAFLHSMDIAFEDSYLNDKASFSRQTIINMMLDLVQGGNYHTGDLTLLHIFVCRNLPKYPQFLFIPPTTLQQILLSLTEDEDQSTREDRQLAAEYLLSTYTPRDSDDMLQLFRRAGFWRILRDVYTKEKQWEQLVGAYVEDPEMDREVFEHLDKLAGVTKGDLEVERGVSASLGTLLEMSIRETAILLDNRFANLHSRALDLLNDNQHRKMAYLSCLLQPEEEDPRKVSHRVSEDARHDYISLLTRYKSSSVIVFLDSVGSTFFNLPKLVDQFEKAHYYPGQLWALDAQGETTQAFQVVSRVVQDQGADLASAVVSQSDGDVHLALSTLDEVTKMAVRLCKQHSDAKTPRVDDMWFGVLHELLEVNHDISPLAETDRLGVESHIKNLVSDTLSALVSSSSAHLSFPRLFKRLVESTSNAGKQTRARDYAQFKSILLGMLESFRAESDMLIMTTRLVQDDLFEHVRELKEKREAGWRPKQGGCGVCGELGGGLRVLGSGEVAHQSCKG